MGTTKRAKDPPKRLGSLPDASTHLGVSTKTIRRWIDEGKLTGYRVGERFIRVDMDEVERLSEQMPKPRRSA
jgi:excisionase family DNA binding protein